MLLEKSAHTWTLQGRRRPARTSTLDSSLESWELGGGGETDQWSFIYSRLCLEGAHVLEKQHPGPCEQGPGQSPLCADGYRVPCALIQAGPQPQRLSG